MAANYVGHLVTFRNCEFEAELITNQELPIKLLVDHLEASDINNAIPYLMVSDKDSGQIYAIYRVDGPHQHTIQPKNLTLIWKQGGVHEATPKVWLDERQTADKLKELMESIEPESMQTVEA